MLGFLIAVGAGFLTPQLEGAVAKPIIATLKSYIPIQETETRVVAFMAALLIAAICAAIFNSGSIFGIVIGTILGYFGLRIYNALKKVIEGRTDAD